MSDEAKFVRRRKRAPRDLIPEGEFRNVTFRAGSIAYNLLAEAAKVESCSISEVTEDVIKRTISGEAARTIKPSAELWGKLAAASEASGRSIDGEVNFRLDRTFVPVCEIACDFQEKHTKAHAVIQMLSTVFGYISFEDIGQNSLSRAALTTAFEEILNEVFPPPFGLLSDIFDKDDEALKQKLQPRMKQIAQQIIETRRETERKAGRLFDTSSFPFGSLQGGIGALIPPLDPRQAAAPSPEVAPAVEPVSDKRPRKRAIRSK